MQMLNSADKWKKNALRLYWTHVRFNKPVQAERIAVECMSQSGGMLKFQHRDIHIWSNGLRI